jgi:hypothetical protein
VKTIPRPAVPCRRPFRHYRSLSARESVVCVAATVSSVTFPILAPHKLSRNSGGWCPSRPDPLAAPPAVTDKSKTQRIRHELFPNRDCARQQTGRLMARALRDQVGPLDRDPGLRHGPLSLLSSATRKVRWTFNSVPLSRIVGITLLDTRHPRSRQTTNNQYKLGNYLG